MEMNEQSEEQKQNAPKQPTLQELISSNPLIDAFMGAGAPVPRRQHPEKEVEAILASIDSCNDIESLVSKVESDLTLISAAVGGSTSAVGAGVGSTLGSGKGDATSIATSIQSATLAARLARIKSLMYNERTTFTSFAHSLFRHSPFKTIASALLHSLLLSDERKMLFPKLLANLHMLPFEARKDFASIFNYLLVCGCGSGDESSIQLEGSSAATVQSYTKTMIGFVNYVDDNYEAIMKPIIDGHYVGHKGGGGSITTPYHEKEKEVKPSSTTTAQHIHKSSSPSPSTQHSMIRTVDIAIHCGSMLRSTMRHPKLYAQLVSESNAPLFVYPFLDFFVNQPNFEVASDALETLRLIMFPGGCGGVAVPSVALVDGNYQNPPSPSSSVHTITNPAKLEAMMENIAASFLDRDYEPLFVERFNVKLLSSQHANYITRRVSLQVLSTILLTRANYNVMVKYISNRSNLKTIMMLLRDPSAHITLDAFNVFKIFVVNPNKPVEVVRILADNKVKLIKYLSGLHQEKEANDEQFRDEKALVIATLQQLN